MILPTINVVARPCGLPPNWFTANTNTTYCVNPVNAIIQDPPGCARESYDINTGNFLGFLIESASSNLLGSPAHRNLTLWSPTTLCSSASGSGIKDATNYNDCSLLAPTISVPTASATKTITGLTTGKKYTLSAYVKVQTSANTANVTITNGSVTKTISNLTGPSWTRIYIGTITSTTSQSIKIEVTGASVYVDFVQFELGNLTSAIAGTTLTRSYDKISNVSTTPGVFSSLINDNIGTFYIEYTLNDNDIKVANSFYSIFEFSGGSPSLQVAHITDNTAITSDAILIRTRNMSSIESTSINLVNSSSAQTKFKLAISYISFSTLKLVINGGTPIILSISTPNIPPTFLNLGYIGNFTAYSNTISGKIFVIPSLTNQALDGHLNHFAYFPSALSDTDLQAITTI